MKRLLLGFVGVALIATLAFAQNPNRVPQTGVTSINDSSTPTRFLTIDSDGQVGVKPQAATTGGATGATVLSAASTNSTSVKATAGTLYGVYVVNTNAATAYLKFYDKASAPTCASDTILTTHTLVQNVPVAIPITVGLAFAAGIGLCITGAAAANDNTNATTGITVSLVYK